MARYGKDHKDATKRRIVEAAGRRLKSDGIDGSGVAALMGDAGLTNGAFYAHFASKDDLVAAAIAGQLSGQRATLAAGTEDPAALERFIRDYLSSEHRDHPADGCPSAALLDEISRSSPAVRRAYTDGILAIADDLASRLSPDHPAAGRMTALQCFATLIGTLQLARAVADSDLSQAILEHGVHTVLAQIGVHDHSNDLA